MYGASGKVCAGQQSEDDEVGETLCSLARNYVCAFYLRLSQSSCTLRCHSLLLPLMFLIQKGASVEMCHVPHVLAVIG